MSHAAWSVLAFGVYMLGEGLLLLLAPNLLLGLFGLPAATEIWVRVVGISLLVLAYYYLRAARAGNQAFFRLTSEGRALQLVLFVGLVGLGGAPPILIALSFVEFLAGVWTFLALGAERAA